MKLRSLLAAIIALAFASSPAHAQLLNFYFTFTTSSGNISGEIEGLQSGTGSVTSTPSEIVIFSQPAGFTYPAEALLANGYQFYNNDDTFTVTSGAISASDTVLYKLVGTTGYQAYGFDASEAGYTNVNGMVENNNGTVTSAYNSNGFVGANYTPVPETQHMAIAFLLAGVALLAGRKLHGRFSRPTEILPLN
jgi:hypothetical protein